MAKKKKQSNTPRCKRMKRQARLQSGRTWLNQYTGTHLIQGYSKHYGVSRVCAIVELTMLGIEIPKSTLEAAQKAESDRAKQRQAQKLKREQKFKDLCNIDSDERFAYIAGYTANGAPYGTTWEELNDDQIF